jgi:formylglycine-generating enzyme required for sulfatase activity
MIEASPSRCTPEQWTAEQAARAMGVVDEADGEAKADEDGAGEAAVSAVRAVGREQPNPRGGMRWVAGGAAIAVVATAAWWSGAGSGDSWEIPVHAGADGALIAGERTPSSGSGDFNSSNGSSHMKIQTTAAAALLGAAASAFQAQAGDAVQWRVADGGNGHWYQRTEATCWRDADSAARAQGCHLASVLSAGEAQFCTQFVLGESDGITVAIGGFRTPASDLYLGWRWTTDETFIPGSLTWMSGNPGCCGSDEYFLGINRVGHIGDLRDCPGLVGAILEWSADCNSDGIVDYGQILAGTLDDANANGVPDRCECATNPGLPSCCLGDIVNDRTVNGADLGTLLAYWGPVTSGAFSIASDLNNDGDIDGSDLGILLAYWGACPTANVPVWATPLETQPDPAVVTDPALRAAIVATGLPWRVRDTGTGIEMLLVPQGAFEMGCVERSIQFDCAPAELPVHVVTLTNPFYMGRYEVTQSQWSAKMITNPSYFQGPSPASRPVENVSWNRIQSFLRVTGMRLPTEAEWEFACRAGTQTPLYNGSNDDSTVGAMAWYVSNSGNQTNAIGSKAANSLGFHDMLGNVWEWVRDGWGYFVADAQVNPTGPDASESVVRGGCYADGTNGISLRSSFRYPVPRNWADRYFGFRVARNP